MSKIKDLATVIVDDAIFVCPLDSERYELAVALEELVRDYWNGELPPWADDLFDVTPCGHMRLHIQLWWHRTAGRVEGAISKYFSLFSQPAHHQLTSREILDTRRLLEALKFGEPLFLESTGGVPIARNEINMIYVVLMSVVLGLKAGACRQLSLDVGDPP